MVLLLIFASLCFAFAACLVLLIAFKLFRALIAYIWLRWFCSTENLNERYLETLPGYQEFKTQLARLVNF